MVHFLRKWFGDRVTLRKACSFNDETEAKWKKAGNNRTNYKHNKSSASCPFFFFLNLSTSSSQSPLNRTGLISYIKSVMLPSFAELPNLNINTIINFRKIHSKFTAVRRGSQSWLATPIRNPYPATAKILWKNSVLYRVGWLVSSQARRLSTAIQVMLYGRLFSTAQPRQATQQLRVTVTAVPVVIVAWWKGSWRDVYWSNFW